MRRPWGQTVSSFRRRYGESLTICRYSSASSCLNSGAFRVALAASILSRARGRRRLPQPARPGPARDHRRRAPGVRARRGRRAARAARPAPRGRRRSPTWRRRSGSRSCSRSPARTPPSCTRRSSPPRPAGRAASAPDSPGADARTVAAYRAWARARRLAGRRLRRRAGVDARAALRSRVRAARAARARPRRALRAAVTLGAAGVEALEADALHVGSDDDATTLAAKRALVSGDAMLLERRAADLADGRRRPHRRARPRARPLGRGRARPPTEAAAGDPLARLGLR